ncbi:COMM domain-containing protein 4 [Nymphon striatum]|nr:COMM domain-containing protein 4 [Nymphon striatum]
MHSNTELSHWETNGYSGDVKACIAALSFILSSAAKYNIEDETLSNELQQLGLPKEHSTSLCKAYADKFVLLQNHLKEESLRLSHIDQVKWRVDYILSSNHLKEINEPMVTVCLKKKEKSCSKDENISEHALSMTSENLRVLLHELKEAARMMDSLT